MIYAVTDSAGAIIRSGYCPKGQHTGQARAGETAHDLSPVPDFTHQAQNQWRFDGSAIVRRTPAPAR